MKTATERFEEKYVPVPESGCWIWEAGMSSNGYGLFEMNGPVRAHRASYILFNGLIPDGMFVMHTCDTPLCVNPAHLVLGTHLDNISDRDNKSRQAKGIKINTCKLTENEVIKIKNSDKTNESLAIKYGVSKYTIRDIKHGITWKHLSTKTPRKG